MSASSAPMELAAILRMRASDTPDSPAVICDGETQSAADVFGRACRLADALTSLGLAPGDRVATLGDNGPLSVEQMAGLALGGFVRASLYSHNSPQTNRYLLDLVGAKALVVDRRYHGPLAELLTAAPTLGHVLVYGEEPAPGAGSASELDYEQALAAAEPRDPGHVHAHDENYIIRFSAGTTGKPKGILHTHAGWTGVSTEMAAILPPLGSEDRYLAAGPLAHAAVLPVCPTLSAGGAIVVARAFEPASFAGLVSQHRCTVTVLVPTMIQMLLRHPAVAAADLSSLRAVFYGAAPISEHTLEQALALWGNIMYQVYGQSEAVPLTVLPPEDHVIGDPRRRLRSAGRPAPHCTIRIVDAAGADVPAGEVGEIAARSPTAMAGIWQDPKATAERILDDGSVLTRDVGSLDDDGYLYLADRKEDMIISGGFNIWPAELENALASHPAVAEVAVVGVAHEKWGETPKAVVVLREGTSATEEELIEYSRERLGSIKRVTSVEFVDDLPKTPVGKVLRRVVRDRYRESEDRLGRV
jgi:acyl-CoA synthetase (AMP-forming)/AMP-acid ligase II